MTLMAPKTTLLSRVPGKGPHIQSARRTTFNIHFLAVDDEWYAVQMSAPSGDQTATEPSAKDEFNPIPEDFAGYNLLRWSDGELLAYDAVCTDSFGALAGVEVNELGCLVTSMEGLSSAVRYYAELVEKGSQEFKFEALERVTE